MLEAKELIRLLRSEGLDLGRNPMSKLHTLRKQGLIPKPQRIFAGVHGSRSVYPLEVLERLRYILRQQQDGYTMKQIAMVKPFTSKHMKHWLEFRNNMVDGLNMKLKAASRFLIPYSKVATHDQIMNEVRMLDVVLDETIAIWLKQLGLDDTQVAECKAKQYSLNLRELERLRKKKPREKSGDPEHEPSKKAE